MRQSRQQRSVLSLERKLPMLIGGLVAAALIATLLLVNYELRYSAVETASERLDLVTQELTSAFHQLVEQRQRLYERVAADSVVVATATANLNDVAAARTALDALRQPADGDLPIVLLGPSGRPIIATGRMPPVEAVSAVPRASGIAYGPFMARDSGYTFWVSAPVRSGGSILGHVAQQRAGGAASAAMERFERLLGNDIEIFVTHEQGSAWAALDGRLLGDRPEPSAAGAAYTYAAPDGAAFLAFARPIPGTPWALIAQMPLSGVTARMDHVLTRVAFTGILLLLLGLGAAWLLSRSVTRPLRQLAGAADGIAAGDYSRRVLLARDDEIGKLARSFDVMAAHIDATHAQLEQRFRHAQSLASELELANARLQLAIEDADTARSDAQQASSAKSEFLATMSHEIRTPINAIIGYTDLMDMRLPGPLTTEQDDYLKRIRLSGEHLISIVNDVLDFAKIESGQMRIARDPTSARSTAQSAVDMLQARARAKKIRVAIGTRADLMFIGDPQRAQQILLNLLSNALKFTADGGNVDIRWERRESRGITDADAATQTAWTCISVSDTGIGIEPDQLHAIFEPFVQGHGGYTRPHGGTGLGLAISRSLARMMDGDLTVESEPGAGSTFTLWLPGAHAAAAIPR